MQESHTYTDPATLAETRGCMAQTDSGQPPGTSLRSVQHKRRFATVRAVIALALREMATTYGRSPGGYVWAVLEPAAGIALLTAVFSLGFKSPPIGSNFPIFYATGLVPFLAFNDITNKVSQAINFSKPLLAYPSVTFIDALLGRFLINTIAQLMVMCIILAGIFLFFDTRTVPHFPDILTAVAMTLCLAAGIGTLNCFLVAMFPVYQRVWSIITRPLLLVSCIFYMFDNIPDRFQVFLWWNPLVHVVGQMRKAFYPSYDAAYVSATFVFLLSLTTMLIGLVFLARYHRDLLNN